MYTLIKIVLLWSLLLWANPSQATLFWSDDFELHLNPNWVASACAIGSNIDGCPAGPKTSTTLPHAGTHSLWSHFDSVSLLGGGYLDRQHTPTEEIWSGFWYYTAPGFQYYSPGMTKHYYHANQASSGGYPNFLTSNIWGSRQMIILGQGIAEACGTAGSGPVNSGYDGCNYYANRTGVPLNDGHYYCIAVHIKMNTPGVADGVIEMFVDGTQTHGYYNRTFRGPNPLNPPGCTGACNSSLSNFTYLRYYAQAGSGDRYVDQFAVGTTRADVDSCGGSPPPGDVTPPGPPTGVGVD